jgi:hypothetical protein
MVKVVAYFGCFALAVGLMGPEKAAGAEQTRAQPTRTVQVRVLPDGKYLYKGKEITASELKRLGKRTPLIL